MSRMRVIKNDTALEKRAKILTNPRLSDSAVKYASWMPSGRASGGVLLAES